MLCLLRVFYMPTNFSLKDGHLLLNKIKGGKGRFGVRISTTWASWALCLEHTLSMQELFRLLCCWPLPVCGCPWASSSGQLSQVQTTCLISDNADFIVKCGRLGLLNNFLIKFQTSFRAALQSCFLPSILPHKHFPGLSL